MERLPVWPTQSMGWLLGSTVSSSGKISKQLSTPLALGYLMFHICCVLPWAHLLFVSYLLCAAPLAQGSDTTNTQPARIPLLANLPIRSLMRPWSNSNDLMYSQIIIIFFRESFRNGAALIWSVAPALLAGHCIILLSSLWWIWINFIVWLLMLRCLHPGWGYSCPDPVYLF